MIYANMINWMILKDTTTVNTFKQYLKFQNRMAIGYNVVWCLITLVIILILSA